MKNYRLVLFIILLATMSLVATYNGALSSSASANQHATAAPPSASFVIDGVSVKVSSPILPSMLFAPTSPGSVDQVATSSAAQPLRAFTVQAIPYGTKPSVINAPVAMPGGEATYRQVRRDAYVKDSEYIEANPTINIFDRQVEGWAAWYKVAYSDKPVLIAEWVCEAGSRIWVIQVTQEQSAAIAPGTAQNFFDLLSRTGISSSTLNQPSTLKASLNQVSPKMAKTVLPGGVFNLAWPAWWGSEDAQHDCDGPHYDSYNPQYPSAELGGSYLGMVACGPRPNYSFAQDVTVTFPPGNWASESEWECPELSSRYMYLAYGVRPYVASGGMIVWNYNQGRDGGYLVPIHNGNHDNIAPRPGDVLSYGAHPSNDPGHTSVVIGSFVDGNGNGHINVLEQNSDPSGTPQPLRVQRWWVVGDAGAVSGWLTPYTPSGLVTVLGRVVDALHNPQAGMAVRIRTGSMLVTTDDNGYYKIFDVQLPAMWVDAGAGNYTIASVPLGTPNNGVINEPEIILPLTCHPLRNAGQPPSSLCDTPTPTPTLRPGQSTYTPTPGQGGGPFTLSNPTYDVQPGSQVAVTIHLHSNTYTFQQSRGDLLYGLDERYGSWPHQAVRGTVGPGQDFDFNDNFIMTVPTAPGIYTSHWQMMVGGNLIGPISTVTLIADSGPQPTQPPPDSWHIQYYNDKYFTGVCHETYEVYKYIFKDWGDGGPSDSCPTDFGARFTKQVDFASDNYSFHCSHDDGCRIIVDGHTVVDAWWDGRGGHDGSITLSQGTHTVEVDMYDQGGEALLEVWWKGAGALPPTDPPYDPNQWRVSYWGNRGLSVSPVIAWNEASQFIADDWGSSGVGYNLPAQNFSLSYIRSFNLSCGRYTFNLNSDDGVRLYVNYQLVLDYWQNPINWSGQVDIPGGRIPIRIEYNQASGGAHLTFNWTQLTQCTPTNTPTTTSTPVPPTPAPESALFGDGRDGDLSVAADQVVFIDDNRASLATSVVSGSTNVTFNSPTDGSVFETKDAPPEEPWVTTGFRIAQGERLRVAANPQGHPDLNKICYASGNQCYDAAGNGQAAPSGWNAPGLSQYSLVGKIGINGTPFYVGPNYDAPAATSGELYLGLNDTIGGFSDNSYNNGGVNFSFDIQVYHSATPQFTAGDLALIAQVQGSGAGAYEIATVAAADNSSITFTTPLQNSYTVDAISHAIVQKVPQYRSVTVAGGGEISARQWDGSSGGFVAFKVQDQLSVASSGRISGFMNGFLGGLNYPWDASGPGNQGDSYTGAALTRSRTPNAGGGGGGQNAGGGGGGYGVAGDDAPKDFSGDPFGYGGLTYGDPTLQGLFLGSGGGGSSHAYSDSARGGYGGGAIYIFAYNAQIDGQVVADGFGGGQGPRTENFAPDPPNQGSRSGGGGSGGSIKLVAGSLAADSGSVTAAGGQGGHEQDHQGEGGNGGAGRIRVEYCTSFTGSTNFNPPPSALQITCLTTPTATATPATPVPTDTPVLAPLTFTDLGGNVFYGAIQYLYRYGAVGGTGQVSYSPSGSSTRGQFAKVVVSGFGFIMLTPPGNPSFTDVAPTYFAYPYIETGFYYGVLSGFDAATCGAAGAVYPCYLPNRPITRGQLTKLVVNAAGYPLYTPTTPDFVDVPPSNIFFTAIETAHEHGVINGYSDRTFRPNQSIRRDEMAQIVFKGVTSP